MVLSVVEAKPTFCKPRAADVSMRIPTGERCGFGASATSLTRASPMHYSGASEGSVSSSSMKLVNHIGSSSTRGDEISPHFSSSAAAPSIRSRVFISGLTSAPAASYGC